MISFSILLLWYDMIWYDMMWCEMRWGAMKIQIFWSYRPFTYLSLTSFSSSHPLTPSNFIAQKTISWATSWGHTCKRIVIHLPPAQIQLKEKTTWLRYYLPLPLFPLPALFSLPYIVPAWSKMNVYSFPLQTLAVMERLSEEHNHRSDPATSTSLVPLQLANYHILKRADSLPTNNRPATKVIIRPPPSILCWIFFFFLFLSV